MLPPFQDDELALLQDPTLAPEPPMQDPLMPPPDPLSNPLADPMAVDPPGQRELMTAEMFFNPIIQRQQQPITLSDQEKTEMLNAVTQALSAAESARSGIDEKIRKLRKFIRLAGKREVKGADGSMPYEGVPNVMTPLTASRMDAVRANVERTFFRTRPFFSAVPETPKAQRSSRAWETFMENELRATDSIVEIKKAIHQAIDLHAGIVAMDVEPFRDTYRVYMRAVDIENFYIYPTATPTVKMAGATFERLRIPNWKLKQYAEQGFFDQQAVDHVTKLTSSVEPTPTQEHVGTQDGNPSAEDWALGEVWLTWIRWRGRLWQVYWSKDKHILFRVEENFLPIDRPPYENINATLEIDSFYSLPLSEMVQSYQEIVDSLYNSILAEAQFSIAPPFVTRDPTLMSDIAAKGWAPGAIYQGSMMLDENNFRQIPTRLNVAAQELIALTNTFAEAALPSVPAVPPGGRKTRYEVSVFAEASSDRMGVLIGNIALGLRRLAETYWELVRFYRIQQIEMVYRHQDSPENTKPSEIMLIGPEHMEIPLPDLPTTAERNQGVANALILMGIPPQLATVIPQMLPPELDNLIIHSAYRDDLHWQPSGGDTVPERVTRQQALQTVTATASFIPAARKDRGLWHVLQKLYENSGITDWLDILGPAPDVFDDVAIQQAVQVFGQTVNNRAMAEVLKGGQTE